MTITLTKAFLDTVARHGERTAMRYKEGGTWKGITYAEYGKRVRGLACGLVELGSAFGDRIVLLSENRPEWVVADQGILMTGAACVPVYSTLTPKQTAYMVNDCGAKIVITSTAKQLEKLWEIRADLPHMGHIIVMGDFTQPTGEGPQVHRWSDVMELGNRCDEKHGNELKGRVEAISSDTLASIVYTSGTTGDPKGAMLTHGNFGSNMVEACPLLGLTPNDTSLSFLPLSHVFERVVNFAFIYGGACQQFAESIDAVPANLQEVHPTIMASVPRLYEKIKARVLDKVAQDSNFKQGVFKWAMEVAKEYREARDGGKGVGFALALKHSMADRLVFSAIRERTGGNLRACISGGAPLPLDVGQFFDAIGIKIIEGYGLTETSPVICFNRLDDIKYGTVGKPIPHVEVKLAADGELLCRGPNVMKGYYNQPEATAQAIDADGWFATGDIAEIGPEGHIKIVDRKKEILVMSNGKNVAPQPIENAIKGTNLVEQCMLIGDRRNYISALIVPNFDALKGFLKEHRLEALSVEEQVANPQVIGLFKAEVDKACEGFARYEQVKKFTLLPRQFDPTKNEMTPTLKVKRKVICENFAQEIEAMYASEAVSA
ncbi:MAG: long-chain fatty-acid-CoA ligase [Cyanobacteria bacterium RYN_339]|nr:long-chain fatty-acid-CoA ligase [Cyanobacteria bacterium RYN_339]